MFRALAALFLFALPASAEDWSAACRSLGSESATERDAAIDLLRKAGPEAAPAIELAAKGDGVAAALAGAVRSARKWDPEAKIGDLNLLAGLDASQETERTAAIYRLTALGSAVAWPAVRRVMEHAGKDARSTVLLALANAPGRDPGWARESCRWLTDPDDTVRASAIQAATRHAGREQLGDFRAALSREQVPGSRQVLRRQIVWLANSLEDLPPFPDSPEDFAEVLSSMASNPASSLRLAAWNALEQRPPAQIPPNFWDDSSRLLSCLGIEEFENRVGGFRWLRRPPVGVRAHMALSLRPEVRRASAAFEDIVPTEVYIGTTLLNDPDPDIRSEALRYLERWDYRRRTEPESERRAGWIRFGAAVRAWLDLSNGAGERTEALPATRALLQLARSSGGAASTAFQALSLAPGPALEALAALETDVDLGTAAKRLRRLLRHGVAPRSLSFGQGLDDPPRLRWTGGGAVDVEDWKRLAHSTDAEEKHFAADMAGGAWDGFDTRDEVGQILRELAADPDQQISQMATVLLAQNAPGLLPDRENVDARDCYARSRREVLAAFQAAMAPGATNDLSRLSLLNLYGSRTLLISTLRAERFSEMNADTWLTMRAEPALVPLLVARAANLEAPANMVWFGALASCSPQGARCVVAFAREAAPPLRGFALEALLSRPWADELSEEAVIRACSAGGKESRASIISALRTGTLRSRPPLRPRVADAVAAMLLDLAASPDGAGELEAIVQSLGSSLAKASIEWRARLRENRRIAALAAGAGVELNDAQVTMERVLLGAPNDRQPAMLRLPAERLETIRLVAMSWVARGRGGDISEAWILNRTQERTSVALLAWAGDDPGSREALLDLRMQVMRWTQAPAVATASMRVADAEAPAEFFGASEVARSRAGGRVLLSRSPALFASLCAAAFRGGLGDDVALARVAPLLGPEALWRLAPVLDSRFPASRILAAQITGRLGSSAPKFATAALRAALAGEAHPAARAAKLAALARLGDERGSDGIRALVSSASPDDRLAATNALAITPTREAVLLLAGLARDDDIPVCTAAENALRSLTRRVYSNDETPWDMRDWARWLAANPDVVLKDPMVP
ncbi:MAG: hypothetical protein K8T20_09845 [Planctomycetes bacterium]|nr:hypothetical protein [Planctomycetota bacterium]